MDFTLIGAILLGWILGQGINYLSDVLPATRRFSRPVCSRCGEARSWRGYLTWQGCENCGAARSWRSWAVQVVSVAVALWMWAAPSPRLGFWVSLGLFFYFGVVAVIDLEYRLILHPVSLVGMLVGGSIGIYLHGILPTLIGGAAGFGIMLALYYLGEVFAKWMAHRRGETVEEVALGFGDVNLSGVLGLLLGWPGIVAGLLVAILIGGAVSLLFILSLLFTRRYRPLMAIPYAPFLILGAIVLLFRS